MEKIKKNLKNPRIYKIAIGSSVAYLLAKTLSLQFATSAGIVTLLTVQNTKKATLELSLKRLLSFLMTIIISYGFYGSMGFHALSFGLVILSIVFISYCLEWQDAISVNAVIATHFLGESHFSLAFVMNEFTMVFIGTVVAILLNSKMPDRVKEIKEDMHVIENMLQVTLRRAADYMLQLDKTDYDGKMIEELEAHLEEALERAFENLQNTRSKHPKYYIEYMEMRKSQCNVLHAFHDAVHSMTHITNQTQLASDFLRHIANSLHERNNTDSLLLELKDVMKEIRKEELPKTHEEFENQAILYHMILDMEEFLQIKKDFVSHMTEEQIKIYWEDYKKQLDE